MDTSLFGQLIKSGNGGPLARLQRQRSRPRNATFQSTLLTCLDRVYAIVVYLLEKEYDLRN